MSKVHQLSTTDALCSLR